MGFTTETPKPISAQENKNLILLKFQQLTKKFAEAALRFKWANLTPNTCDSRKQEKAFIHEHSTLR